VPETTERTRTVATNSRRIRERTSGRDRVSAGAFGQFHRGFGRSLPRHDGEPAVVRPVDGVGVRTCDRAR
jgi:hypothetical protein